MMFTRQTIKYFMYKIIKKSDMYRRGLVWNVIRGKNEWVPMYTLFENRKNQY